MKFDRIQKLTLAGALAALTTVATLLIQIPSPTKGYINTGDVLVNLSAWILLKRGAAVRQPLSRNAGVDYAFHFQPATSGRSSPY